MTFRTLLRRSLRFHARSHLGVVLGAAIGSAALIGALLVGDSVRGSLRDRALQRLAHAWFALAPVDRVFGGDIGTRMRSDGPGVSARSGWIVPSWQAISAGRLPPPWQEYSFIDTTLLELPGIASIPSGSARANQVQVFGVDDDFWRFVGAPEFIRLHQNLVVLNPALASQLRVQKGDEVVLRVQPPGQLPGEAAVNQRGGERATLRLTVAGVLPPRSGGDFDPNPGAAPPFNAFVSVTELQAGAHLRTKPNLYITGPVLTGSLVPHVTQGKLGRYALLASYYWNRLLFGRGPQASRRPSTDESLRFLTAQLTNHWTLRDADLRLEYDTNEWSIELRSPRVFLEPPVAQVALKVETSNAIPILTFLANLIVAGTNATPYSMVTAAGPPYTPADMKDDEILISQWLADDLGAKPGDSLELSYFLPDSAMKLTEATNRFRVRAIVPQQGIYADRTLMPDFPGIEKAESTRDWDPSFPLVHKIRPQDEAYWQEHRGTPKAYVTLAAGQKMWANRFGQLTAIRFPDPLSMTTAEHGRRFTEKFLATLKPEQIGLRFEPVRERALKAAEQSQDFGQLFLGFSIFLVVAALLLMALLFQFGLEQRATEVGTLLALGFTPKQVRRLLLAEGATLALAGGVIGALGGMAYAKAMLWGLATVWHGAVENSILQFHAEPISLLAGMFASTIVAVLTIWLTLRKQARQPARELLAGEVQSPKTKVQSRGAWLALAAGSGAAGIIAWTIARGDLANAGAFFGAGSLLLLAGLALAAAWLGRLAGSRGTPPLGGQALQLRSAPDELTPSRLKTAFQVGNTLARPLTLGRLAVRSCARRRKRSLATVALLACGCFVIVAIGVFRLDANQNANKRSSGTGGFALIGESTLAVAQDLNSNAGRDYFGLSAADMAGVLVVAFRVRQGDEASCLNLNRAQQPRLLGVKPELLAGRFTFAQVEKGGNRQSGWTLLGSSQREEAHSEVRNTQSLLTSAATAEEVPAVGDANSIEWALGKKVGDTIDYTDERGRPFKVRLVGAVANSILQGSLVISDAEFVKRFPSQSGYQMFLLDAPTDSVAQLSARLSRALQDVGLELTAAVQRLNAFNAVQNTYLGTFQILGGLGLLLGSAGLGVVVLRNVLERRGELGLLVAVGFRRRELGRMLLSEHGALLAFGLSLGTLAALVAVLPAVLSPGTHLPYLSLALTLAGVLLNGAAWTWIATRAALRGNLLNALRNE